MENEQASKKSSTGYIGILLVIAIVVGGLGWVLFINTTLDDDATEETITTVIEPAVYDKATREFSIAEMAAFDGKDGSLIYTAYKGVIYDVSASPLFEEGKHYGHMTGLDLTEFMVDAPHADEVFVGFESVGLLEEVIE